MENCKFCEIDKEFGGEYFGLNKFTNVAEECAYPLDSLVTSYLRLRKIDGKPSITASMPYETKDNERGFGIASTVIKYCPFCGRDLEVDLEMMVQRKRARLMMRKAMIKAMDEVEKLIDEASDSED